MCRRNHHLEGHCDPTQQLSVWDLGVVTLLLTSEGPLPAAEIDAAPSTTTPPVNPSAIAWLNGENTKVPT